MRNLGLLALLLCLFSCVRPKLFHDEQTLRLKAEARESILVKEVLERRGESAKLTETIGTLNRSLGNQDAEIAALKGDLTNRTQEMGESSSKLATEKSALQKELNARNALLGDRNALIGFAREAQEKRKSILSDLKSALEKAYDKQDQAVIEQQDETVQVTLSDKTLFESSGQNISSSGKNLLAPFAAFLAERPGLDVEVRAYTDNKLPKDKSLKDTWDWSLQRATNLVRLLISEFNLNANKLTPVGKGEFYPITSNETPEGREKNRRTVLILHPTLPAIPSFSEK
jgi:chemotaxis protein MotB